jgi:hypothetical protein
MIVDAIDHGHGLLREGQRGSGPGPRWTSVTWTSMPSTPMKAMPRLSPSGAVAWVGRPAALYW